MKELKPYCDLLKEVEFRGRVSEISYRIKSMLNYDIDFDVFLPTKARNLQRGLVWSLEQKQELILSILLGKHIPHIAVIDIAKGDGSKTYLQIIDGKQRLSTLIAFAKDGFPIKLEGSEYLFSELPDDYKIAYLASYLRAHVMVELYEKPIADEEKIKWFKFLNFAGTPQDKEYLEELNK